MNLTDRTRSTLAAAAILVVVAGCASSGAPTSSPAAASSAPSAAASAPASAAASPEGSVMATVVEVDVANDPKVGGYLTGADGKTLYLLGTDKSGQTTCTNDCAANWPPFTLDPGESAKAGAGVTGTIGTFTRPDGSTQVTINGLPLYYFAGDTAAGQINGQGIGNKWYAASPAGMPTGTGGGGASPAPSATGYNY